MKFEYLADLKGSKWKRLLKGSCADGEKIVLVRCVIHVMCILLSPLNFVFTLFQQFSRQTGQRL